MPLPIECPNCATRFRVGDHVAGKRVKCKNCGEGIHVPDAPNLEKAKVLPVRHDVGESLAYVEPVIRFPRPNLPHGPLSDAVISAEAFVAAEAIRPQLAASRGVGVIVRDPLQIAAVEQAAAEREAIERALEREARLERRPMRPSTAAPEGFSPLLLLMYVLLEVVGALYLASQQPAKSSLVWTRSISELITFFSIVGPMTWLGVWCTCRSMRFELAAPAYIKSCALAAMPGMLLALIHLRPDNPVLVVLGLIWVLPATFFLIKLIFALSWRETLATFLLGFIGWTVGWVIQILLITAIVQGAQVRSGPGGEPIAKNGPPDPKKPAPTTLPAAEPIDPIFAELDRRGQQAHALLRSNWTADVSREQASEQLTTIEKTVVSLKSQAEKDAYRKDKYDEDLSLLNELTAKIAQLPSELPDPIINEPIFTGRPTWPRGFMNGAATVSFKRYRMDLPTEAKIDLASAEDSAGGLSWDIQPHGTLNIYSVPRRDFQQYRPWVRTRGFMKGDSPNIFSLDMVNVPVEVKSGALGTIPATRIASIDGPGRVTHDRFVKYVISDMDSWVVVTATADLNDARTLLSLENLARSVHLARENEPHLDALTPDVVVGRLREDRARAIVLQRGAAAEPALLARIHDSDPILRRNVIELLGQVGTKKSVPDLLLLCSDQNTDFASAAREAVKKLSPDDMDDTTIGLMDMQSYDPALRKQGVAELAAVAPKADEPRRKKVAGLLTQMVQDGQSSFNIPDEVLGDALAVWQTADTVPLLLPLLDPKAAFGRRRNVMNVLARIKDKRAAGPIVRCLVDDAQYAQEALISMGSVAEDDVLKVFDQKTATPKARAAACNILAEIGTAKSIKALACVVSDHKCEDVDSVNTAILQIQDRIGSKPADADSPATPTPTPAPPPGKTKPAGGGIWIPPTAK